MKKVFILISAGLMVLSCAQSTREGDNKQEQTDSKTGSPADRKMNSDLNPKPLNILLSLTDAEKILGQSVHLSDSLTTQSTDVLIYQCTYTANTEDSKTKKTGALYLLVEQYTNVGSAKKKYTYIKKANQDHEGVKDMNDLGDEAYFHSDNQNFYFVMVRKGVKVFNMKVNKITSTTSLEAFNGVAKQITYAL